MKIIILAGIVGTLFPIAFCEFSSEEKRSMEMTGEYMQRTGFKHLNETATEYFSELVKIVINNRQIQASYKEAVSPFKRSTFHRINEYKKLGKEFRDSPAKNPVARIKRMSEIAQDYHDALKKFAIALEQVIQKIQDKAKKEKLQLAMNNTVNNINEFRQFLPAIPHFQQPRDVVKVLNLFNTLMINIGSANSAISTLMQGI